MSCIFVSVLSFREKEKAELKDAKVLEILQNKDDKIETLQQLNAAHGKEIEDLLAR